MYKPPFLVVNRKIKASALLVLVCLCLGLQVSAAESEPRLLVIGGLHAQVDKLDGVIEPMAKYIENKLSKVGPIEVVVVFAQDREHLARLVRHGRVDWVSQTAYNATYFLNNAEMNVLARGWRGGSPTYRSVFFVRKDSQVNSLNDLTDHTIAFEHPYSTSAFFVPKAELESYFGEVELLADEQSRPAVNHVGYKFSRSEYNSALWVHKGIVDAGVFSSIHWGNEDVLPEGIKQDLKVIHETKSIVRALELVRHDLDEDIKDALIEVLGNIHADSEAEEVRSAYYNTQRFDAPTEADLESIDSLTKAAELSLVSRNESAEMSDSTPIAVDK